MTVTWLAGLYLAWSGHWFASGWLHVKLALVLALSAVRARGDPRHLVHTVGVTPELLQ